MSTPAQAAASRANGSLSQGPVTQEGKAASSQNALRHGLRSAAVVLPGEDPEAFDRHRTAYLTRFKPADAPERDLVEAMAASRWRLNRIMSLEAELLQGDDLARALSTVARYEGQLTRTYDRAYRQLQELQSCRPPELKSAPAARFPAKKPNEPSEREVFAMLDALTAPPSRMPSGNSPGKDGKVEQV